MKKLLVAVFCAAFLATPALADEPVLPEGVYSTVMWVDGFTEDSILFVDGAGLCWEYESEPEDWCIGDTASMIMWDHGTPETIYDDVILTYPLYGGIYGLAELGIEKK